MFEVEFFWPIIGYLLGSIPFGYLTTRWSTGRNILEVGWRKTSGSNVLKNIGIWQGALTGIFDLLKGYLAVYLAQRLGFSTQTQVLAGVGAVCGHNWSIFLRFAGGRGIGTLIGVLFAFSPRILGWAMIPFIALGIIWNLSIGTIVFLIVLIFIARNFGQFNTVGMLVIFSLIPIFIKRLSPIKEIFRSKEKLNLVRNRLLFDDDISKFDLRIKRILKKI